MSDEVGGVERRDDIVRSPSELVAAMALTPTGDDRFEGVTPAWYGPRQFGGFIVAQALSAMSRTVSDGRRPHSLHGHFLRPVLAEVPVELEARRVRDGRSFATRQVTLRQNGKDAFLAIGSFTTDEDAPDYALPISAAAGDPERLERSEWSNEGPFDERDLGADGPDERGHFASTGRRWFKLTEPLGTDDPALHACVVAFLSDMTGNAFRPLSLDAWEGFTDASLDHALWFHRPPVADDWLFYDLQALVEAGGRSTVRGTIHDRAGRLVASMAQELLIRPTGPPGPGTPGP